MRIFLNYAFIANYNQTSCNVTAKKTVIAISLLNETRVTHLYLTDK